MIKDAKTNLNFKYSANLPLKIAATLNQTLSNLQPTVSNSPWYVRIKSIGESTMGSSPQSFAEEAKQLNEANTIQSKLNIGKLFTLASNINPFVWLKSTGSAFIDWVSNFYPEQIEG